MHVFLSDDQFGFRSARKIKRSSPNIEVNSTEQIKDRTAFLYFIDIEKAFSNINWNNRSSFANRESTIEKEYSFTTFASVK